MSANVTTEGGDPIPDDGEIKNRGRYGKYWDKTANVKARRTAYGWFIILAIVLIAAAVVDIAFLDAVAQWGVLGVLGLLILIAILMYFTRTNEFARVEDEGGEVQEAILQCPECQEVFEFKETHLTSHGKVAFSCPMCGKYGALPGIDAAPVKKRVPDEEAREYEYRCTACEEEIRVGVFGDEETFRSEFRACPNCQQRDTVQLVRRPPPPADDDDEGAWQAA